MSILKKRKKEEDDELEKILSQIKEDEKEENGAATVTIQIAGLKELVKAIEALTEAIKKCEE